METDRRKRFSFLYMYLVAAVGAPIFLRALYDLPVYRLDLKFIFLVVTSTFLGSRVGVEIPRIGGRITVADTLVFLTLLCYGGEAAILLATTETLFSSLRVCKRPTVILFNASMMACSTFITVCTLRLFFGDITALRHNDPTTFIVAVCVMALVQYVTNSGLVAFAAALQTNQSFWPTWKNYYLWTSVTFFAGASVAGGIARVADSIGIFSIVATAPVILIIYFTYRTYLKNVKNAEAQAAQARRHVEELNHFIAEQERIREQFIQVEKLSALGQMASGVAHDFNNSLASILGRAELLMKHTEDPRMTRGLEIILKSAQDGAETVKRIQDFARQRSEHAFESISVDQLLSDVSEITRPRWRDGAAAGNIHINLDLQNRSRAHVSGAVSELRDVLVNMIFNAVHAMPAGGELTLAADVVAGHVIISVIDTGVGMPAEVRSRVFDPFFTTKGVEGMGLGLAVAYGVIRRHQGTFEVESAPGKGSAFRITLPLASASADDQNNFNPDVVATSVRRINMTRILVVDDEENVRNLLKDILEDADCEVIMASQAIEGLRLFNEGSFDAVFTDVGMPGMSGWELARAIRQKNSKVPLAIITGWGETVTPSERDGAQVDWVVAKPFTMDQIGEIAREVSRRREEEGQRLSGRITLVA